MASNLAPAELLKYDSRINKFLEKYNAQSPFELIDGRHVVFNYQETIATLIRTKNVAAVKTILLITSDGKSVRLSQLKKTAEFEELQGVTKLKRRQQGFIYENNAYNILETLGIAVGGVAGASHDRPDLSLVTTSHSRPEGCELKIAPTAAGSLVLKYHAGQWGFGDIGQDQEKLMMKEIADQYNLLENMNTQGAAGKNWRGKIPVLQNDATGKKILTQGVTDKREAYKRDIEQFKGENEVHIVVPAKAICDYYNRKRTYYLNVGTHGFYLMNLTDPLKLNAKLTKKIEDFAKCASARIRVRCQPKGSGDYQFAMTLEFSKVKKSSYNLCPVVSDKNVKINTELYETPENKQLLAAFKS